MVPCPRVLAFPAARERPSRTVVEREQGEGGVCASHTRADDVQTGHTFPVGSWVVTGGAGLGRVSRRPAPTAGTAFRVAGHADTARPPPAGAPARPAHASPPLRRRAAEQMGGCRAPVHGGGGATVPSKPTPALRAQGAVGDWCPDGGGALNSPRRRWCAGGVREEGGRRRETGGVVPPRRTTRRGAFRKGVRWRRGPPSPPPLVEACAQDQTAPWRAAAAAAPVGPCADGGGVASVSSAHASVRFSFVFHWQQRLC